MLLKHSIDLFQCFLLSKVQAVSDSCTNSISPASRSNLADTIRGDSDPLIDFTKAVAKKRDTLSNCARRLVLGRGCIRKGYQ